MSAFIVLDIDHVVLTTLYQVGRKNRNTVNTIVILSKLCTTCLWPGLRKDDWQGLH